MRQVLICFFLVCCLGCIDTGKLILIDDVPSSLPEISGLQLVHLDGFEEPFLAAINDSGNTAKLYLYKDRSKVHAITIQGVENRDWEDLAIMKNKAGKATHLIIADIGDNSKSREAIQLVKIPLPTNGIIPNELKGESYDMTYANGKSRNAEALIYHNDSVFVFSKESEKGYKFFSKVYAAQLGNTKLNKQYEIGIEDLPYKQKVTAADINENGQIALLSRSYIFTYHVNQARKSQVSPRVYNLEHNSQKEALTYINDSILYLADESKKSLGGNMYQFTLNDSSSRISTGK